MNAAWDAVKIRPCPICSLCAEAPDQSNDPPEHCSVQRGTSSRALSVITERRASPGRSVSQTARSRFSSRRTPSCCASCCWYPPVTGGRTSLAAATAHFAATQQEQWPPIYALTCEVFDAAKCVAAAAGIRWLIKSPITTLTLRDAVLFVLAAVVLVPFGAAFWGAAFTISYGFGTRYWIEWRNLAISNAVTTVVLVPAFLLGAHHLFVRRPRAPSFSRALEASLLGASTIAVGLFVFDGISPGPATSPALLVRADPAAHMGRAPFRPRWHQRLDADHHLPGDLGHHARPRTVSRRDAHRERAGPAAVPPGHRNAAHAARGRHRGRTALEGSSACEREPDATRRRRWQDRHVGVDVQGNDVWMSERGRSLFGLASDARLDFAATAALVHPEDRAAREGAIRNALKAGGEYEVEYRLLQADGKARWIQGRGRGVVPEDGSGPKLFGVSMDITRRKEAEAAAAQKRAELEHVARVATLGELTTTLTHELRQPLAAILVNAHVGERLLDAREPDFRGVRGALADIREITERAGEVIVGLQAMLKRGSPAANLTDVDVNNVIRIVERITHGDANRHRLTVHLELSSGLAPVKGDSVQLQQVILNLLLNAFSAMNGSGPDGAAVRGRSHLPRRCFERARRNQRQRHRHRRRAARVDFRPLRHQQGRRAWHGPVDLSLDHRTARRYDLGGEQLRRRRDVLDHPPCRCCGDRVAHPSGLKNRRRAFAPGALDYFDFSAR